MTIARRRQICLEVTPYYHCITRCVRRSYLCGYDKLTKQNFDHRRGWIENRLLLLAEVFCIDVAGYAILSNHHHLVLKVNKEQADSLPDDQVVARWLRLYRGTDLAQRYHVGESLNDSEQAVLKLTVAQWRDNLSNLSRFMGNLNEYIARKANKEDGCTGVFWQSRFKSQAILDLPALLQTLCYVDLNPVRAKMARTPEQSKYTSVRRRLHHRKSGLLKFESKKRANASVTITRTEHIPIDFKDYLELLDWTGRELKKGKRGAISSSLPSIVTRLGYTPEKWMKTQTPQVSWTQKAIGSVDKIKEYCVEISQKWIWQIDLVR